MHYHIVGIGGAGMSALAHVLLDQGHHVSGSDLATNRQTAALNIRGVATYQGHHPDYIAGADALLVTSAVRPGHPEVAAAQEAGIPLLKRTDLWREWSQQRSIIAVAGSHGKTTTTAMIALVLSQAGLNPGFLVGSDPFDLEMSAQWGDPAAPMVIEADEYDHAFLSLYPSIAVVTNIDWDHPDIYPDAVTYRQAFVRFAGQTNDVVLMCGDRGQGTVPTLPGAASPRTLSYGLDETNDYRAVPAHPSGSFPYTVYKGEQMLYDDYRLASAGLHNIRNGLAVFAVADLLGLDMATVGETLHTFRGTARRLETKGEAVGITVIDDYAHHPTEVRATLAALRQRYGTRRIVAYLQPHTYSRTRALLPQWGEAFADADVVLVGAIYAAREVFPDDVSPDDLANQLVQQIARFHHDVCYVGNIDTAVEAGRARLCEGDVLITLGAGDGYLVGETIIERLLNAYEI